MLKFKTIEVQKAVLNNYDISVNLKNVTLYNDIDNVGYVLELLYNDVSDIKNKMPLRGGEQLELIMVNKTDRINTTFKKSFILSNVVTQPIDKNNVYIKMTFTSKESFLLGVTRDYSSYNDTITNIVNSYKACKTITPDLTKKQILIPGWSQTKAIRYASSFLDSYFYFEVNDGFRFENINDLIIKSKYDYFINSNNPTSDRIILDIDYIQSFDTLNESYDNIYDKTIHSFNPSLKIFGNQNTKVKELQTKSKTFGTGLNFNPTFLTNIKTRNIVMPYYDDVLNSKKDSYTLFNKTVDLVIHGDLSLQVGDSLNLILNDRFNSNPSRDSGNYLISKIAHHISNNEYTCKVRLSKNSPYKDKLENIYTNVVI